VHSLPEFTLSGVSGHRKGLRGMRALLWIVGYCLLPVHAAHMPQLRWRHLPVHSVPRGLLQWAGHLLQMPGQLPNLRLFNLMPDLLAWALLAGLRPMQDTAQQLREGGY